MEEPEKRNPFFVMMEEMQANSNLTEEEADALAEEAVQAVRNANKIRSLLLQSILEEAQANSDLEPEEVKHSKQQK